MAILAVVKYSKDRMIQTPARHDIYNDTLVQHSKTQIFAIGMI